MWNIIVALQGINNSEMGVRLAVKVSLQVEGGLCFEIGSQVLVNGFYFGGKGEK